MLDALGNQSRKRLFWYKRNLAADKEPKYFDDKMENVLKSIAHEPEKIDEIIRHCDSIDWNQSTYSYHKIAGQVKKFTLEDVPYGGWRYTFRTAKSRLIKEVSKWNLKMLDYRKDSIVACLPRLDTHAGYSYLVTGKNLKGDYVDRLPLDYAREEAEARINGSFNKPILIGSRTQSPPPFDNLSGERKVHTMAEAALRKKTRLVSMIDIYQICAELKFAKPFQQKLVRAEWYSGGKSDRYIGNQIYRYKRRYTKFISLDYSSYDQSISAWMIREAFDVIREAFDSHEFDEELFKIIREDFINKVFITPDGLVEAHKGVPSGSMWTQIIDSIVNRLMIDTYMNAIKCSDYRMLIMGDDNLIFINQDIDITSMSDYLMRNFGCEMNPSKVDFGLTSGDIVYLSRYWRDDGVWRHPNVLIAKLCYPERFRDYRSKTHRLTPCMIVKSYFDTFPLGMSDAFDICKLERMCFEEQTSQGASEWLSGLAGYRARYGEVVA